jgi:hypothetical protein
VAVFFAGSARYLLPLALPVAILASRKAGPRLLWIGVVCGGALSLTLAVVNYQFWSGYRDFARSLKDDAGAKRVWINGDWGLRYYLESEGGLALLRGQSVHPGDVVVSSALSYPVPVMSEGGALVPVAARTLTSTIPLRLIALNGRSAYSTTSWGLRPFDVSRAVIDRVRAEQVVEREPVLSDLPMNAPEADQQILSGVYGLEDGRWRWMAKTAVILLKSAPEPAPLEVKLFIPDMAPARQVVVRVNDQQVAVAAYPAAGSYILTTGPIAPSPGPAKITISVDKSFTNQSDTRELGIILTDVGFKTP